MTTPLPRKLGPILATMFVTGNMVGSGLFLLPATMGMIGGISIFTWILATAGALVIASVFARLGVIAPWAGGPYAYARATMGRYFGFQTNYIYWIQTWVGNVGIALAVTGYVLELLPGLRTPFLSAVITSTVIWIMVGANIWGPRVVGKIEASAMLIGLAPILAISLLGWFFFDPKIFWDSWNVSGESAFVAVPKSMIQVFWAFTGLESAAVAVEVIENPKRNLPIAAMGGVAIAAVIYTLACTVPMGIVPARELAASSAPFALVATRTFGPAVAAVIVLTTILKASGTHGGWTLVAAATAKAAADDKQFPGLFGQVDRRGVPVRGLLVHGVLMSAVAFATMSPTVGEQFSKLVDMSVVYSMTCYAYSAYALCRLRPIGSEGWRTDWAKAIVAAAFSIWVIVASDLSLLLIAAIVMATSIPLYPFFRGRAESRNTMLIEVGPA
jgi:arginine:agmatine antiporter